MKTVKSRCRNRDCAEADLPIRRIKRGLTSGPAILMLLLVSLVQNGSAQVIPPGVPEPGLVLWGTVVNQTNVSQAITISSASWSVTDGTNTAVYAGGTTPATRIVNMGGQSYYILQVPFDTRQIGAVALADPATVGIASFPLKSSLPPTYTLTATINGALASVRFIDGAPASGAAVPASGFTSATRGRVIRVDLAITPVMEDYSSWATRYFGSSGAPNAALTADPDGDGMNNQSEYAAGTDPTDENSALKVLTLVVQAQPLQASIKWQSASNRTYVIETATAPQGPWSSLGSAVPSSGTVTEKTLSLISGDPNHFYRVRLGP